MNKKRAKYKVKAVPVAIAIVVLLVVLGVLVATILSLVSKNNDISGGDTSSSPVSQPVTNDSVDESSGDDNTVETPVTPEASATPEVTPEIGTQIEDVVVSNPQLSLPIGYSWDWNLVLINSDNGLDDEMRFNVTRFDTQEMDARLESDYRAMYTAAKNDGVNLYVYSAYRSIQQQLSTYTAKVQEFMDKGYLRVDALEAAKKVTPEPGHCEHHTGLALDIVSPEYYREYFYLDDNYLNSTVYAWLLQNAPTYGFVLRYPADKVDITKVNFEPWHFRYVGVDHALYMTQNNLCLEEYLQVLAKAVS